MPTPTIATLVERARPRGWGAPWAYASLVVMPLFLALCAATVGVRAEHGFFALLFIGLAWVGPRARRFSALSAPFVLTGIAYDLLRLVMPYRAEPIHTGDLFAAERMLFPVSTAQGTLSVSEAIAGATTPVLDLVTGATYLTYLVQVFGVAALLYVRRDEGRMLRLAFGFALVSVLGWAVWLVWPAAPPWYIDVYGPGPAVLDALPSAAGAARFDDLLGVSVFSSLYARSSNVFGAMPSLHVGYAVLTALVAWSAGGWLRRATAFYAVLMAFSAVYLRHHYVLDVAAGALLTLAADAVVVRLGRGFSSDAEPCAAASPAAEPAPGAPA